MNRDSLIKNFLLKRGDEKKFGQLFSYHIQSSMINKLRSNSSISDLQQTNRDKQKFFSIGWHL